MHLNCMSWHTMNQQRNCPQSCPNPETYQNPSAIPQFLCSFFLQCLSLCMSLICLSCNQLVYHPALHNLVVKNTASPSECHKHCLDIPYISRVQTKQPSLSTSFKIISHLSTLTRTIVVLVTWRSLNTLFQLVCTL